MLDIIAWHGFGKSDHKQKMDTYKPLGYRTLSLSVYNTSKDPRYACVVIKRPVVVDEHQFVDLDKQSFQSTLQEMAAKGMGPHIVSATGPANDPLIAAVFIPLTQIPTPSIGISASDFIAANTAQLTARQKLRWFDCYGSTGDERYIAVWLPDPEMMSWNCDGVGESPTLATQRHDGMAKTWSRCAQVLTTPSGNITSLYTDSYVGTAHVKWNLSADEYQNQFDTWTKKGLVPLRVCVQGAIENATFGVAFGEAEETNPRIWQTPTPASETSIAAADAAIEAFMKGNDVRNAAVAIVSGARLVYVKGYTLAEPNYDAVQPTTLFRLASCSKVFTAYALYRLLQQQADATPANQTRPTIAALLKQTTLQSILHLTQPNGSAPADPHFNEITLWDLITSTSGINQSLSDGSVDAAQAAGASLPATRMQLAQFGAAQALTGTPGDTHNVVYGNFDYFLLGEVIRELSGAASYEAAVKSLIMSPLGMTRVRGARSLLGDQLPDEAAYHMTQQTETQLQATQSERTPQRPLVANQYGGYSIENLSSSGGLSAAVVDMARVLASLSAGADNPVLTVDTVGQWLTNAALTTSTYTGPQGHGYHGWDWVSEAGNGVFSGAKGGSVRGAGTEVYFTTEGMCYLYFNGTNSPFPGTGVTDWAAPLTSAVSGMNWGTTDLFPQYGMASF